MTLPEVVTSTSLLYHNASTRKKKMALPGPPACPSFKKNGVNNRYCIFSVIHKRKNKRTAIKRIRPPVPLTPRLPACHGKERTLDGRANWVLPRCFSPSPSCRSPTFKVQEAPVQKLYPQFPFLFAKCNPCLWLEGINEPRKLWRECVCPHSCSFLHPKNLSNISSMHFFSFPIPQKLLFLLATCLKKN